MKNKTILIVDDVVTNLDILSAILTSYDVIAATNGEDAIHMANSEKIDLILLDIMMPNIDGYEVCKRIKSNKLTKDIPILFITAKSDIDSIERAYECGGADYVNKPISAKEILSKVNTQLIVTKHYTNIKELTILTKPLKILFVEDDEDSRLSTSKILSHFFDNIDLAVDGIDGITQFHTKPNSYYDLIITDINMPRMNGIEMSKAILNKNRHQNILAITAHNDIDQIKAILNIGITNYIHKPVNTEELIHKIEKTIGNVTQLHQEKEELTQIKVLNEEISAILENVSQGFLSFGSDFKIKKYFSKECLSIFNLNNIYNLNIIDILFNEDTSNKTIFIDSVTKILNTNDKDIQDTEISLLPIEHTIENKNILIEYKSLQNNTLMLILTDITTTKEIDIDLI